MDINEKYEIDIIDTNSNKSYYKKYYINNKERLRENQKRYLLKESAKEKRRACARKNYLLNKDKFKNKEYKSKRNNFLRSYTKKKRNEDNTYRLKELLRNRVFYALRDYTKTGKIMKSNKYGINYRDIIEHLKPFPENLNNYNVDHIIPLVSFNLTNPEEIKKAFAPENHQWLTIEEHKIKTAKERLYWRKDENK